MQLIVLYQNTWQIFTVSHNKQTLILEIITKSIQNCLLIFSIQASLTRHKICHHIIQSERKVAIRVFLMTLKKMRTTPTLFCWDIWRDGSKQSERLNKGGMINRGLLITLLLLLIIMNNHSLQRDFSPLSNSESIKRKKDHYITLAKRKFKRTSYISILEL